MFGTCFFTTLGNWKVQHSLFLIYKIKNVFQASRLEQLVRDKEEKFAAEQKATERKAELVERQQKIGEEDRKVRHKRLCGNFQPLFIH